MKKYEWVGSVLCLTEPAPDGSKGRNIIEQVCELSGWEDGAVDRLLEAANRGLEQ